MFPPALKKSSSTPKDNENLQRMHLTKIGNYIALQRNKDLNLLA